MKHTCAMFVNFLYTSVGFCCCCPIIPDRYVWIYSSYCPALIKPIANVHALVHTKCTTCVYLYVSVSTCAERACLCALIFYFWMLLFHFIFVLILLAIDFPLCEQTIRLLLPYIGPSHRFISIRDSHVAHVCLCVCLHEYMVCRTVCLCARTAYSFSVRLAFVFLCTSDCILWLKTTAAKKHNKTTIRWHAHTCTKINDLACIAPLSIQVMCVESVACTIKKNRCHVSLKQVGEMKTKPKTHNNLLSLLMMFFFLHIKSNTNRNATEVIQTKIY